SRRYAENYGAFTALAGDIIPELWLLSREPHHSNSGPVERLTEFLFTRQSAKVSKVNAVPTVLYPRRSQPIADSAVAFDHQWCRTFSHPKVIFSRSVGGSPLPLRSVLVPVVMVFNKLSPRANWNLSCWLPCGSGCHMLWQHLSPDLIRAFAYRFAVLQPNELRHLQDCDDC